MNNHLEFKKKAGSMLIPLLKEYGQAFIWSKEGWKEEHLNRLPEAEKVIIRFLDDLLDKHIEMVKLTLPQIKEERDYSSFEEYEKETERRRILQDVHNKIATL